MTEQVVAVLSLTLLSKEIETGWPKLVPMLQEFNNRFAFQKEDKEAKLDFFWACVALRMSAINNLFPKEQAARLEKLVLDSIKPFHGDFALKEIAQYRADFKEGREPENRRMVNHLLHRWVGDNIEYIETEVRGNKFPFYPDPLLRAAVHELLIEFAGSFWRKAKEKYPIGRGQ